MESSYVLILLVMLIIILVGVVFFGHRQLTQLSMIVNQHASAIQSIRIFLERMLSAPAEYHPVQLSATEPREFANPEFVNDANNVQQQEREEQLTEVEKNIEEQIEKEAEENDDDQDEEDDDEDELSPKQVIEQVSEAPKTQVAVEQQQQQEVKQPVEDKKDNVVPKTEEVIKTDMAKPEESDVIKTIEIKGKETKGNKQKFPTDSPKELSVGATQIHDGKLYVVYESNNGIKRWKLFKP